MAGGRRWWYALYAGDDRVQGHGIIPMGGGRLMVVAVLCGRTILSFM